MLANQNSQALSCVARSANQNPQDLSCVARSAKQDGGEAGIRTLGGLPLNGFQDRRFRPLSHLSV